MNWFKQTGFIPMFDVFCRNGDVHGVLVCKNKNQLVYVHDKVFLDAGADNNIFENVLPGTSYELVSNDEVQQVNFESAPGLADGTTTEVVLRMLIHREEVLAVEHGSTEAHMLAIRAMKMAIDALQRVSAVT